MIFEIAVGAFIALAVYDLVLELAQEIEYRVNRKRRAGRAEELLKALSLEPYVYLPKPVRKKAAVKPKPRKKAAAKRK